MIQQMISWLPQLLNGAKITILLTLCAVSMGLLLSIFLALGKMSKNRILSGICSVYIFFFRGTPLLMQLYFIYFGLPQINMALTINSPPQPLLCCFSGFFIKQCCILFRVYQSGNPIHRQRTVRSFQGVGIVQSTDYAASHFPTVYQTSGAIRCK